MTHLAQKQPATGVLRKVAVLVVAIVLLIATYWIREQQPQPSEVYAPFAAKAAIGQETSTPAFVATVTSITVTSVVTAFGAKRSGGWVVIGLDATATTRQGTLGAVVDVDGARYQSDPTLPNTALLPGISAAVVLAMELPATVVQAGGMPGAADATVTISLGTPAPTWGSAITLTVNLDEADRAPDLTLGV